MKQDKVNFHTEQERNKVKECNKVKWREDITFNKESFHNEKFCSTPIFTCLKQTNLKQTKAGGCSMTFLDISYFFTLLAYNRVVAWGYGSCPFY